jgi:hypothetical protein
LTDARLRERRAPLREELASTPVETSELPEGYAIRFAPRPTLLERLARFIELERRCCPFMTFTLEVRADHGPVTLTLTLTGPTGTREFLRTEIESLR